MTMAPRMRPFATRRNTVFCPFLTPHSTALTPARKLRADTGAPRALKPQKQTAEVQYYPVVANPEPRTVKPPPATSAIPRILVVEDEPAMNQHIADILHKAGFHVTTAFDGIAGLQALSSSTPDLIILDIFMPQKDGLEMLVELRRSNPDVPVLIISGKQHLLSGCSMSLAEQLGASAALAKPFTPKELLNHVAKFAGILPVDAKKATGAGSSSK